MKCLYKSFDFNFVSFSFFQQSEWQTQCYNLNWPRCEGGGTLPQKTSEDATRSWGKLLPLVIFDKENSDIGSFLSMDTGVLSIGSGHVKHVSQHLLPKPDSTLAKLSNVQTPPSLRMGIGITVLEEAPQDKQQIHHTVAQVQGHWPHSGQPPVQQRGDVNRRSS